LILPVQRALSPADIIENHCTKIEPRAVGSSWRSLTIV